MSTCFFFLSLSVLSLFDTTIFLSIYKRLSQFILNKGFFNFSAQYQFEQVLEATPYKAAAVPPIMKTIKVRRTRHAGHCWSSRDKLISDVLLWNSSHGRAKAGRPARTYIQQLCEDTGCSPAYLPEAMNDREEWRERIRDIHAGGSTRWWPVWPNKTNWKKRVSVNGLSPNNP